MKNGGIFSGSVNSRDVVSFHVHKTKGLMPQFEVSTCCK